MSIQRVAPQHSLVDVLDRVLDKGLVIDMSLNVSLAGIDIVGVEAQIVVASIQTYEKVASPTRPALRRSERFVATADAASRRRRPRRTVNARCQHGCTFVMKRDALPSTVTCPFDGSRIGSVAPPVA
jgi:gas vesicle structural protein